ncbi:hypothetical protein BW730_13090 [Tessaracoccus aquimaris]|uniref:Type II secretion system protein GspF domain-containing protein n=1 Tax=Tessaracoccus aquimaris TaxID=1332264 RepID=A0A1Q2CQ99_9ACTN|nr:type II secretion system F family protein [Tessaracoccus aquimaris]AQP48299.1 hypothetical protein BW730_13090 [Tessaracoccus aquimaris]
MGLSIAILSGCSVGLGAILLVAGMIRAVPDLSTQPSTTLWTRLHRRWETLSRGRRAWVLGALLAGVLVAVASGWLLAAILIPVVFLVVPWLLSAPTHREVETLAGLDRWVRLLGASLSSGKSIRDAIFATRRQVPDVLQAPVAKLCARLDQRWSLRDALWAMGDEMDSADGDAVVAALAIAGTHGGAGARATLEALSDTIQHRLRALREIAAERAKPRAVVRQVTVITLVVLIAALVLNPTFFAPYGTPIGQLLAATLVAVYLGCLAMLRRRTVPPSTPRFLRSPS